MVGLYNLPLHDSEALPNFRWRWWKMSVLHSYWDTYWLSICNKVLLKFIYLLITFFCHSQDSQETISIIKLTINKKHSHSDEVYT